MKDEKVDIKKDVENDEESSKYFSLSPRSDLDIEETKLNFKQYEDKLDWALKNSEKEDIKNIAITGYYGSGKSSVLKTFIKKYHSPNSDEEKYKFLELSLATFHDDKEGSDKVKDIEKSLLQQIFYKVEDDKIPHSRFSKITNKENFNFFEQGLICIIILLVLVRLYNLLFSIQPFFGFYWLDLLLLISVLFIVLLKIKLINKVSFKKLRYKNLEVEIEKDKSELSILSRFLDEIIYFFKETNYNVVVIEDIDRFESTEIFSNLRELNLILNNSDLIGEQIVFIYAIKNEQFNTASDRTKFFDFIIPVIPVINYETAPNLFIKNFSEIGDEQMIRDLFALVDDARVIYNTINELKTYIAIIGQSNYSEIKQDLYNKLIPLVFYKNVEPFDFSCLLKRKGYLYSVLQKEEIIKSDRIKSIKKEIETIQGQINSLNEDNLKNLNELKRFILSNLVVITAKKHQIIPSHLSILSDSGEYIKDFLIEDNLDSFDNIFENRSFKVKYHNSYSPLEINKNDIEEQIGFNITDRLTDLKEANKIKIKENKISELEKELNKIANEPLHNLIRADYINLVLEKYQNKIEKVKEDESESDSIKRNVDNTKKQKIPDFEIIKTLITNGYIDNAYFLYLSNHSDLELTFNDHRFWLNIKNNRNIGFHHKLTEPKKIGQKLVTSDYNSSAILNFDFINYCFKDRSKIRAKQRSLIIEQLAKLETLEIEFLSSYFERCTNEGLFIKLLCDKTPFLWQKIIEDDSFKNDLKNKYFEAILKYADVTAIYQYSINSNFNDYIYKHQDIISLVDVADKIKEITKKLELLLRKINFNTDKKQVLDFLYINNRYTISPKNVYGFFKHATGKTDETLHEKILTQIVNHKTQLESMYNYIFSEKRLETFVEKLIINIPSNTKESKNVLIDLLNKSDNELSAELKSKLIKHEDMIFPNVSEIDEEEIQIELLKNNKLAPNLENIIQIWNDESNKQKQVDTKIHEEKENAIAYFLNQNISPILKAESEDFQAHLNTIIRKIILLDKIDNQVLEKIIKIFEYNHSLGDQLKNLSKEKICLLVDNGYFEFNDENIDALKTNYRPGLAIRFIETESIKDMSKLDDLNLDDDLILNLLDTREKELKKHLSRYYLDNIQNQSKKPNISIVSKIAKFYINSDLFLDAKQSFILKDSKLDVSNAVKLLNKIIETLPDLAIKEYLSNIDNNKYKEIADETSRPHIPNDNNNLELVKKLKSKGIISSYKEKNQTIQVFKHKNHDPKLH